MLNQHPSVSQFSCATWSFLQFDIFVLDIVETGNKKDSGASEEAAITFNTGDINNQGY